jgi:inorganic pyrophosphatase
MSFDRVPAGRELPDDFNVVIEIPMNADPIKYEIDKETGTLYVDRFMGTAMRYPCNYGYIPNTISDDGDPVDVLVITPFPLGHGVVVRCRPVGVLNMSDEAGGDAKVLAVPIDKILSWYKHWREPKDIQPERLEQIRHFFEHYKDLEKGKWVKVEGWSGSDEARREILGGAKKFSDSQPGGKVTLANSAKPANKVPSKKPAKSSKVATPGKPVKSGKSAKRRVKS